jgi:AcrR family transcriptional regulator
MGIKERRIREKRSRIAQIEKAAKSIFFEKGYQSTTLEEVAESAEISKSTIYLYYENKDDLYVSLMSSAVKDLGILLADIESKVDNKKYKNGREIIAGFFEAYRSLYLKKPEEIRIIQAFQQGDHFSFLSKTRLEKLNALARHNYAIARRVIRKGIKAKLIRDIDPYLFSDFIWASFLGIVQLEESKLRSTKKNHILETLEFAFTLIGESVMS